MASSGKRQSHMDSGVDIDWCNCFGDSGVLQFGIRMLQKLEELFSFEYGNHWVDFRGGQNTKEGTHFWARFAVSKP